MPELAKRKVLHLVAIMTFSQVEKNSFEIQWLSILLPSISYYQYLVYNVMTDIHCSRTMLITSSRCA